MVAEHIKKPEPDARVEGGNGFYQLFLLSPEAKAWGEEHIQYESWQTFGGSICIDDGRMARAIVEGLQADGFVVE